ncbi:fimbria/pilus periplasmic chaperone [Enterobacter cancerogenus]
MISDLRLSKSLRLFVFVSLSLISFSTMATGGISIQGTRVIYPKDARQISMSISNSSLSEHFLVQSWVETASGQKTQDFVITPPLYLSKPGNENLLRLIRTGGQLPNDRESLYYFIAKAIPTVDEEKRGLNTIHIAAATRIKLFVRPSGLNLSPDKAPAALIFYRAGNKMRIYNPTPYYLTLSGMSIGNKSMQDVMVAPVSSMFVPLPANVGNKLIFRTINDYGALTQPVSAPLTLEAK